MERTLAGIPAGLRGAFATPDLRRLQVASVASCTGGWAFMVALSVYAYGAGGAAAVGLAAFVRMLPAGLAAPFVGLVADRRSRRDVLAVSCAGRAAALVAIAALVVAGAPLDAIAKGCVKPLSLSGLAGLGALLTDPGRSIVVPPDPRRGFADRPTYKALHATGKQRDAHGFAFVDADELAASKGQAAYYAFTPKPGLRMIALNTVAEGDKLNSNGNLDSPQFRWLQREIEAAERRDELIVVYGHHPIGSLNNPAADEDAGDCALRAVTGPGCDLDPRVSKPLRFGADLQRLLLAHPHVVAYVAGHTHENRITAVKRAAGGGFWELETASEIDWPIQSRLIELMDNRDGTLSIFGTLVDHGAAVATPAPGTPAGGLGPDALAALAREFAYNDPQVGVEDGAEGRPQDRNVELLLDDPR
jgi:hypothetical protein